MARVEIHCDPRNVRSAAVPRKLGFTHEATLRERVADAEGEHHDSMIWSLFRAEYSVSPVHEIRVQAWVGVGRKIL